VPSRAPVGFVGPSPRDKDRERQPENRERELDVDALALQEATLVVATLMKHFDLDLVPGQPVWPVIDFTMRPRDGLKMTAKRRSSSANLLAAE
jgi:hypothetical protein